MHLDRLLGNSQLPGHFLVDQTRDHQREDLALAGRELREVLGQVHQSAAAEAFFPAARHRPFERVEQVFLLHGLLEEIDRSVLHRLDARGHVTVRAEEDDGGRYGIRAELFGQLDAVDPGHPQVGQDHNQSIVGRLLGEQGLRGGKRARPVSRRLQEAEQGAADRFVVIHHIYDCGLVHGFPGSL